ncbi:MAG: alpha/beta hydrolase [Bacillota bacterium]|nr:alpha/beta hydrolase [Bacillota bacterium]
MNGSNGQCIKISDSNLFYSITGEGEPLVFIHGNFNDSRIWTNQIETFSKQYKVICYDMRGYGKSDTPVSAFSQFEDLKVLLDSLGNRKVTLIGSSSGGSVALDFTLKYPEYVKALVLAAPSINGCSYPIKLMIEGIKSVSALKSKGFEAAVDKFINNPFWTYFIPSRNKEKARELVVQNIKTRKNFYSWNFKLAVPLKPYASKRLNEIKVPVLIVLSDKDAPFNMKVAAYINEGIINSKKVIISDCGHLPFVEKPEEFNKIVLDFLEKCEILL